MVTRILICLSFAALISCNSKQEMTKTAYSWPDAIPPVAEKLEHIRIIHGDTVADDYYWMIDFFKKGPDSTKAVEYLMAENAYLETMMAGTKNFQDSLYSEMKGRIKEKDESVPYFKNGYYYYTTTEDGKQYYKMCRKKGDLNAPEEVLLDVDKLAEGKAYFSIGGTAVSPDNTFLAYSIDEVSRRQYSIHIKNLVTGEIFSDKVEGTSGGMCWANDNKTIFYTSNNPTTLLSEKIKRHSLGDASSNDVVVYNEKDNTNYIWVSKSKDDQYIIISSRATLSSQEFYLNANTPKGDFKPFEQRMKDVLTSFIPVKGKFLILTNWEALNFRLMECPLDKTSKENWKEVIPHRKDVLIEGVEPFKDFIVIQERKDGLIKFRVRNNSNNEEHYVDFGEPTYSASFSTNEEYNLNDLRFSYSSMTTPNSVFDYNLKSKAKVLKKQQEVLGDFNSDDYITERLYATAKDGVRVPISVVYKKGFKKDGNSPLLLYAYGSYGHSMDANFSSSRLSLLNRGFAFAIAHIRGGEEMGRQWYEDGKLMKKKNTFNDFIDCGEFLVKEHYTSNAHLYAMGGSAGGLLMGAIANMAPDMWKGIIAQVPFVDVVNTMLDESIPLTTNEFDEWGNPKNKDAYDYIKGYSPYENVEKKNYPNILVTTGLHDSQVQYFEPSKWVAKLRLMKTDNNILLLHTNMEFGHGGASGRFDYLKDVALNYAFLFALEGIEK
jgi:oligopeptidase B